MSPVPLGRDGMSFARSRSAVYFTTWFPRPGRMMYDWFVIPAAQHPNPDVFRKLVMDGVAALITDLLFSRAPSIADRRPTDPSNYE
jgi:hypothetical protein